MSLDPSQGPPHDDIRAFVRLGGRRKPWRDLEELLLRASLTRSDLLGLDDDNPEVRFNLPLAIRLFKIRGGAAFYLGARWHACRPPAFHQNQAGDEQRTEESNG